jgi:hypothetical protein
MEDVVLDHGSGREYPGDLARELLRLRRVLPLLGDRDGVPLA